MEPESPTPKRFNQQILPWLIAAGALLVYALTLNHWVTLSSLSLVSKVAGWDWWMPTLQAPLFFLVTYPVRWLAPGAQPVVLNCFAALCGAGVLGLLARSVALLPQDRTASQRQRGRNPQGLLSLSSNWVPPLIAAFSLGLTLSFWERAVVATGEVFNLLLFAYVIRCLLEFRLSQRESWLFRMALVYGLATTNNWAMIGFFPLFLAAVVWIRGAAFFNRLFLVKMCAWGLLGLLPYLYLPAMEAATSTATAGFWEYLRYQLALQKNALLAVPRWLVLILSLSSILPVIALGIRWPTHVGDTSATGAMITQMMFHVVHGMFLVAGAWVMFDPQFSPRSLAGAAGGSLPFLTFYYLSAVSIGYFSGYFLLVFQPDADKNWKRPSALARGVSLLFVAAIWAGLIGIPAALAYRNLPVIRGQNGPALGQFAGQLAQALPPKGALVLSDNPLHLLLLQAHYARTGSTNPHVLIDTRSLPHLSYHRNLSRHYPDRWKDWSAGKPVPEGVEPILLIRLMSALSTSHALYYLHPSFGYYFEHFYVAPHGLVQELKAYAPATITPPPLAPEMLKSNLDTWANQGGQLDALAQTVEHKITDAVVVGKMYSRALDHWGVLLQRNGRYEEAKASFLRAIRLNPENRAARVNLETNESLRQRKPPLTSTARTSKDVLGPHRQWDSALNDFGPYDESRVCFDLGRMFAQGNLPRQSVIEVIRARTLDPTNVTYRVAEAEIYLKANLPDRTLGVLGEIRKLPATPSLNSTNQFALTRLEAMAYLSQTNFSRAEKLLLEARRKYPGQPGVFETLAQAYLMANRFTNALTVLDQQLTAFPRDKSPLLNKAAVFLQLKAYDPAAAALDALLKEQPRHLLALQLRALANLQRNQLDAAKADYESIRQQAPKAPTAEFGLGEIAYLQKKPKVAIAHFEAGLKLVPPGSREAEQARQRLQELKGGR